MNQIEKRTDRTLAKETPEVSEQRYRQLLKIARDGILILDAGTGEIIDINPFLVRMLGYTRKELLGKKPWEIKPFNFFETSQVAFRELLQKKYTHYKDIQLETKDGQRRDVEFVSNIYLSGNTQVIQCTLRDITKWKHKVEELMDLAKISSENPNPVLRLDRNGTILFANKASQELYDELGVTKGGRLPKFWRGVVSEALKKKTTDIIEAQYGGRSYTYFVSPVVEANYVNLYGRDETGRKQEEEARRAAEANYRVLVEQIPAISYIDKADGSALSLFVSPQVKTMLGVSQEEWIQGDSSFWVSLIHPDDRERVVSSYQHTINTGKPFGEEYRMFARDGRVVWIDDHAVLLEGSTGQPSSLQGVMFDITERKHAQALQEAVYRIAIATETTESLSDLYSQIHQIISSVMPAENFYITLYDETKNLLRFPYFRDALDEPYLGEIEPGKGLSAYVLRTGKSLLCTQAVHDELERQGAVILLGVPSAIWLGVPLIIEGKTIGVMVVQHYTNPEAYGERELHMLEFVSSQVAIAIKRKQAEDALRESEERFRRIFEEGPLGMAIVDSDDRLIKVNNRLCQMLGYKEQELTALKLKDITHPEDSQLDQRLAEKLFRAEIPNYAVEKRYLKKDHEVLWVNSTASVIQVEGKSLDGLIMIEDITARKQVEEKLRQLSTHDILTGLFNRGYFEAEMARLEHGRQFPVSIVMADLDHLKTTNDSQGHAAGDALLKRLAQVLCAAFRAEDVVARIGGDEFAILLPNTATVAAKKALGRVRRILQEHNASQAGPLLQVSFGASTAKKYVPLSDLLKEADENMYAEKHANLPPKKVTPRKKTNKIMQLS